MKQETMQPGKQPKTHLGAGQKAGRIHCAHVDSALGGSIRQADSTFRIHCAHVDSALETMQ